MGQKLKIKRRKDGKARGVKVRVIKKGRAEKIGNSEWNVTEKLEIELS